MARGESRTLPVFPSITATHFTPVKPAHSGEDAGASRCSAAAPLARRRQRWAQCSSSSSSVHNHYSGVVTGTHPPLPAVSEPVILTLVCWRLPLSPDRPFSPRPANSQSVSQSLLSSFVSSEADLFVQSVFWPECLHLQTDMSAIQLTGSDRWEVLTPVSAGKEDQGVVHIPNSGIVTSNGQYMLPIGSLPSQPIYVTASGGEAAANGVTGIQYQVKFSFEAHLRCNRACVWVLGRAHATCLLGHPPAPKCRRNTCRILNTRSGRRHGSDSASPRWQPRQYRNQLRHNSNHGPPDTGGPNPVNPRSLVGWRFGVRRHRSCRAAQQHNLCPYKQCGSGVAGADWGSDGTHCDGGDARGPADYEQPGAGGPVPGRWLQAAADGEQQLQSGALRANLHVLFQLRSASWNHRRHRGSDPGNSCVCRRVRPLVRKLQFPQPPAANPGIFGARVFNGVGMSLSLIITRIEIWHQVVFCTKPLDFRII